MKLFHEKFAQLAQKHPDKTALVDTQGALTYAQANALGEQLAKMLAQRGLQAGEPVAVFVSRQKEVMVCALGILKAGGVYLPLDEQYPNERLFYMLGDAKARIVLADRDLVGSRGIDFENHDVVFVDEIEDAIAGGATREKIAPYAPADPHPAKTPLTPNSPVMILYTSGTTGNPKGVLHRHALLARANDWTANHDEVAFDETAHLGIMSGFTFVATNAFMFGVLLNGGTLFIAPNDVKYGTDVLYKYLQDNRITHMFMPSSLATTMIENYDMTHTAIFAGGEKLRNFSPLSPDARLYNFYGSTEIATMFSCRVRGDESPVPIGYLTPEAEVRIVDENLQPVSDGEAGELLVCDDRMSLGYLNLPKLTAKTWIEIDGKTFFRTGDRMSCKVAGAEKTPARERGEHDGRNVRKVAGAEKTPAGEQTCASDLSGCGIRERDIFYIQGRIDNMVKLRGFRIETGEVETNISKVMSEMGLPAVTVVVVKRCVNGSDHLCAYYESEHPFDSDAIRDSLRGFLPDYMVPDLWCNVAQMPRNANGKVMRKSLPEPKLPIHLLGATDNETQLRIVECAGMALNLKGAIDPDDSFVSLGGDSLSAMELSSALRESGISVSATNILSADSLRDVADKAKVKYENLWSADELEAVKQRFAERGEAIERVLPLSPEQDDLICYHMTHPEAVSLERSFLFALRSQPTCRELRAMLNEISATHPATRASVVCEGVSVFQSVITDRRIPLTIVDGCESDLASCKALFKNEENAELFDLERTPSLRVMVVNRGADAKNEPNGEGGYAKQNVEYVHVDGKSRDKNANVKPISENGCWLFVLANKLAFNETTLRRIFLQMMEHLFALYPQDAEIKSWVELFQTAVDFDDEACNGVKDIVADGKTNNIDVSNFAPQDVDTPRPDLCIYSETLHTNTPQQIFFVHTGNTGASAYFPLAQRIKRDFGFAVFEPYNLYHAHDIQNGIPAIAAKYIEIMKRRQPSGPYILGGWCYGGVVAHEMACQLEVAGENVAHLIMLDAHCLDTEGAKKLAAPMQASANRRYFETCPLFKELRECGMLESIIDNAARVVEDINSHIPRHFHGQVTYFKPNSAPADATGDVLKYWNEMMKLEAGNFEKYCDADKLEVVTVPGEHDSMMLEPSLNIIVPKLYDVL